MMEAESVKVGISWADLLKVFMPDGGFQPIVPDTYVLRSCDLIKVNVKFLFSEGASKEDLPPETELTVTAISKPYLEPMTMD